MKSGAIILGSIVSLVLLVVAGVLYLLANDNSDEHYREAIDLVREVQQLSAKWSMEVTRVKSDPLADFDSLAAFIPRVSRLKEGLAGTVRLIPEFPDRLADEVHAYVNAIEAQEERIERFKTGYAVIRNSRRYLPLAAANATQQAQEANDKQLAQRVSHLVRDVNLYLPAPTDTGQARLKEELEGLREASVAQPPALANALVNLVSHAEVLVARQGPANELFDAITSDQISDLTDRLAGNLKFELGKTLVSAKYYDGGVLAALGLLALFWILLGVHQRIRVGDVAALPPRPADADAVGAQAPTLAPEPSLAMADGPPVRSHTEQAAEAAALAEESPLLLTEPSPLPAREGSEAALVQKFVVRCVAEALVATAEQISGRMDYLRQAHHRIQEALQNSTAISDLHDTTDLDEGAEAVAAIASSVHQEVAGIADLGKRLASFSNSNVPLDGIEHRMVDINGCVEEALDATGAESVATVAKSLGDVPDLLALKPEFLLLLTKVIENSVEAVQELSERKGVIKVDTVRKNGEILINVIDNGDGITPERRASIFKPFYTSRDGAMGLGLALAGHLVKKYEGTIRINSLPGQGTVARITLPADVPSP